MVCALSSIVHLHPSIHSFLLSSSLLLLFTGLFASSQVLLLDISIHFILGVNRDYCIVFQHNKEYAGASWSFTEWAVGALDAGLYALLFPLYSLLLFLFFIYYGLMEISANSDSDFFSSVQSNTFLSCAV